VVADESAGNVAGKSGYFCDLSTKEGEEANT